jgi:hypothetical protein
MFPPLGDNHLLSINKAILSRRLIARERQSAARRDDTRQHSGNKIEIF